MVEDDTDMSAPLQLLADLERLQVSFTHSHLLPLCIYLSY